MEEQQDNLPEIVEDRAADISFYNSKFYQRDSEDDIPVVAGRRIKPSRACKVCKLVPELIELNDYTWYEAIDAEQDMYRFIYTFWSAEDISKWLKGTHEYNVSHDAISRHIKKHIVDPQSAAIQRALAYRPDFMNKKFFTQMADTMKLGIMKYQAGIATGAIPVSTNDFLAIAKLLKDWQDFLSEMQEDKTDLFMQAVGNSIERALEPYPEIKNEFVEIFREELEKIEKEEE